MYHPTQSGVPLTPPPPSWSCPRCQELPGPLGPLLVRLWASAWSVDLSDAEKGRDYTTIREAFARRLLPGARPTARGAGVLACPADGVVLYAGELRPAPDGGAPIVRLPPPLAPLPPPRPSSPLLFGRELSPPSSPLSRDLVGGLTPLPPACRRRLLRSTK